MVINNDLKDSVVLINKKDNTVTALKNIIKGERIKFADRMIEICDDIPVSHKVAVKEIKKGEMVIKYGESIGTAYKDIMPGRLVHSHNLESSRARGDKRVESNSHKETTPFTCTGNSK